MRLSALSGLAAAVLLVVAVAGCGSRSASPRRSASDVTTVAPVGTLRAEGSTALSAGPGHFAGSASAAVGVHRCRAGAVQISFDVQPPAAGQPTDQTRALIVVGAAASAAPCSLDGFATLRVYARRWAAIVVVNRMIPTVRPGAVVVRAGSPGFAGMTWTSRPGCRATDGFDITLPGGRAAIPIQVGAPGGGTGPLRVCPTTTDLGPFVASAQELLTPPAR